MGMGDANFSKISCFFRQTIKSRIKKFRGPVHEGGRSDFFLNSEKFRKRYSINNENIKYMKFHCNPITVRS